MLWVGLTEAWLNASQIGLDGVVEKKRVIYNFVYYN